MIQLPFIPNQSYKRSLIHDQFGGNRQSGICPSIKFPFIFIFSNKSGQQHGYKDRWDNTKVFSYTGHGQVGDMEFVAGNLALRDHIQNKKHVFLFEGEGNGLVKFSSELKCFDVDTFPTHDTNGKIRSGIKFFFEPIESEYALPKLLKPVGLVAEPLEEYNKLPTNIEEEESIPNNIESVISKVGKGVYLKRIVHRWEYKCAVTGFDKLELLVASNIAPWPEDDQPERQDIDNGILLAPTYDTLFEQHLISFEDSGKIILSPNIEKKAFQKLGISGKETIKRLSSDNLIYLDRHRMQFENDAY